MTDGSLPQTSLRYELVCCGAPLVPRRVQTPVPTGSEVLLRTLAAGVCHTDLHLSDGFFDLGQGKRLAMTERGITLPHTLGHENVGEVVALGPEAQGMQIGERVLVHPWIGCGSCPACRGDDESFCTQPRFIGVFRPGGFGEHLLVPHARYLFPIGSLPPERAAPLACSGLTAFSALMKVEDLLAREPIVIVGAGGLGLMCLSLLQGMKSRGAVVIEPDAAKRDAALALGAVAAVAPTADGMAQLAGHAADGFGAVLDFVGSATSTSNAIPLLRKGGRLVVVGMYGGAFELPIPTLVLRSLSVQGSYVGSLDEMGALMAHVARHGAPEVPVSVRPLVDVNAALLAVRSGQVVGRTVLMSEASKPAAGSARPAAQVVA